MATPAPKAGRAVGKEDVEFLCEKDPEKEGRRLTQRRRRRRYPHHDSPRLSRKVVARAGQPTGNFTHRGLPRWISPAQSQIIERCRQILSVRENHRDTSGNLKSGVGFGPREGSNPSPGIQHLSRSTRLNDGWPSI
jgi:hypothetical protein